MNITYKRKEIANIQTVSELEDFVKEYKLVSHFKSFNKDSVDEIQKMIDDTKTLSYKQFVKYDFLPRFVNEKSHWSIRFWIQRGYTITESEDEVRRLQKNNASKMTKQAKIRPDKWRRSRNTCIEYWLDKTGGNNKQAEELLSQRQSTFSKAKCIEKFGEEEGLQRWNLRQEKWIKSLSEKTDEEIKDMRAKQCHTLDNMKKRHGEEKGIEAWNNYLQAHSSMYNSSKWSLDMIYEVEKSFHKSGITYNSVYHNESQNEYFLSCNELFCFYDYTLPDLKLIFEFNGEHVHPNKKVLSQSAWKQWRQPWTNQTADEIYAYDQKKKDLALKKGFKVTELWYSNPTAETVNIIVKTILKKLK